MLLVARSWALALPLALLVALLVPLTPQASSAAVADHLAEWGGRPPTWWITHGRPPPTTHASRPNNVDHVPPAAPTGQGRRKRELGRRAAALRAAQGRESGLGADLTTHPGALLTPRITFQRRLHTRALSRPHTRSLSRPHTRSLSRPHTRSLSRPHTRSLSRPHTRSLSRPHTRSLPRPHTRSLSRPHTRSLSSPPDAAVPPHPTNDSVPAGAPHRQVVLQEEPYLSPSFARSGKDGQRFKHYRHFYEESSDNIGSERDTSASPRRHTNPNLRNFAIPETIMKDGQIFYRHDAGGDANDSSIKGQSKRSHSRVGEHEGRDDIGQGEAHQDHHFSGSSQAQSEAHMDGGGHGAKAETLMDSGSATQALGSAGTGGFFSAQAESTGQHGATSQTQVVGNVHGAQGSATTHAVDHQSQAHVQVGPHSSSQARIATQEGQDLLISSVDATQLGGSAGAQAHGPAASNSHANMDFNPSQGLHDSSSVTGYGLASAVVTREGGSALASLSGRVPGGSYLGTAHSSMGTQQAQPSPEAPHADLPPDTQLVLDEYMLNGGMLQEDFMHGDFRPSVSSHEAFPQEYVLGDHGPGRIPSHVGPVGEEVEQEGLVDRNATHARRVETRGYQDVPLVDPSADHDSPGRSFMNHDMISDIMETVHQPYMVGQTISYPRQDADHQGGDTIDDGGLTGGAGTPPRESEIAQAPLHTRPDVDEGTGTSAASTHDGEVGHVTYSHSRLGLPPGPGELLDNLPQDHSQYNYDLYDQSGSEYYEGDYNAIPVQQPPYFDLGPEIFNLEPIELSYEDLQPTVSVPPAAVSREQHEGSGMPGEPSIVVHQVQTTTPQLPSQAPPHASPRPYIPLPGSFAPAPTHVPTLHYQESNATEDDVRMSVVQPRVSPADTAGDETEEMDEDAMGSIPLVPGGPGTTVTLPGTTGGPIVNVMTMSASRNGLSSSLLAQRPGTPIQPGEKIPGAPGYRVPPGFRGHVILGHDLPVEADSRRVVEGFNTYVQLSPQSSSTVLASVSGPQASQQLTQGDNPGVRVTLSDVMHSRWSPGSSSRFRQQPAFRPGGDSQSTGAGRVHQVRGTTAAPRVLSHTPTVPRPRAELQSSRTTGQVGRVGTTQSSSGKSWGTDRGGVTNQGQSCCGDDGGGRQPMCRYFTISCRVVYNPYQQGRVCHPVQTTRQCCC